ncbi:hypothetical protein T440DRAFT_462857 [Plenodomus tracheiphilus IPT5]|uniref:Uncharacterized protein n=1 Tax=Plenodomus tracheiphilus IPT5 TaxID=1408161 RepID=A0A6A7BMC1_9PLEO|nr:hypothetical protein T440DRAFT_462857 [Plenodomus tracheiphilus IPT5]
MSNAAVGFTDPVPMRHRKSSRISLTMIVVAGQVGASTIIYSNYCDTIRRTTGFDLRETTSGCCRRHQIPNYQVVADVQGRNGISVQIRT